MKRSTRMAIIAGVAVFLSLTSGVSFAAWTATSTKTATASAGAVAVSTATAGGAATVTAFGPFTYTSTNQTVTKPITARNTGTVDAFVSSVAITRSGTLAGNQIAVKFWVGTSTACDATSPSVSSDLSGGTVVLSSLNMTIAASGSAILCASTSFTGSMSTQAGKSTSATLAVNTSAGTNWNATDSLTAASRSFTQDVFENKVPNAPTNTQCVNDSSYNSITISWSTPSGFTAPNGGYNIYYNGGYIGNVATTTGTVSGNATWANITVRAVASDGTESADSASIPVGPRGYDKKTGYYGISCAS
jgi:hypothetical protein